MFDLRALFLIHYCNIFNNKSNLFSAEQLRNIQKRKKTNAYIELLLWEGDYGTPSVDTDSLVLYVSV